MSVEVRDSDKCIGGNDVSCVQVASQWQQQPVSCVLDDRDTGVATQKRQTNLFRKGAYRQQTQCYTMDPGYITQLLGGTFEIDAGVRQKSENALAELEVSAGFLPCLLQVIMSPHVDDRAKQAGAILFKNRVRKGWDSTSNVIADNDKEFVRQNLLQAAVQAEDRIRVHFETTMHSILFNDHNDGKWDSFVPNAMQLVQSQDLQQVDAGVSAIYNLVKCYRWGTSDTKLQKKEQIVSHIFPILRGIAQTLVPNSDVRSASIIKNIFKSYNSMIKVSLPTQLQSNESLMPWGTLFIQIIEKDVSLPEYNMPDDPQEREEHIWWKTKKWAFSCINALFCVYASDLSDAQNAKFSDIFRTHYATKILEVYMGQIAKTVSNYYISEKVKLLIANFLKEAVRIKETWKLLKGHLPPLIQHFIYPLMTFNDEDDELWNSDPVEFIRRKIDNPYEEMKSPAKAAEEVLDELCNSRFKHSFPIIVQFINGALNNYVSLPVDQRQPRLKDGALNMLCAVSTYALKKKSPIKGQIDGIMKAFVLEDLRSYCGFLRARACNTLSSFGEANLQEDTVRAAFQGILDLLQDKELPVRVTAALALRSFVFSPYVCEAIKPHVSHIMQAFLNIANEIDLEVLTEVMESLVSEFSEELSPFATQLTSQLMESFTRLLKDMNFDNEDGEYDRAMDDRIYAAQGILRTLITLSFSMEVSLQIQTEIENIICPVLAVVLEKSILDLYEETFELIETICFCSKRVSPTMWKLFPLIYQTYKQDATDYLDVMENTLDNMMTFGHDFLSQNPNERNQMFDIMCSTLAPDQPYITNANRVAACELLQAFMLNLSNGIESYIPKIIEIGITVLQMIKKKTLPTIKVVFLEVIINAIYASPQLALTCLEQGNATMPFFTLWFQNLALFTRVHDKKLCLLAVMSMMQLPSLPPSLGYDGMKYILKSLVDIFESYPIALQARKDEESLNAEGNDNQNYGNDDDSDVAELEEDGDVVDKEEMAYLEVLAKRAQEIQDRNVEEALADAEADDDDDEFDWEIDELTEDIYFNTPLDNIDAYLAFEEFARQRADILQTIQSILPADKHNFLPDILKAAQERRVALEQEQKNIQDRRAQH